MNLAAPTRWFDATLGCEVEVFRATHGTALLVRPGLLATAEQLELAVIYAPEGTAVTRLSLTPVFDRTATLRIINAGGVLPMTADFIAPDPPDARYKVVLRSTEALTAAVVADVAAGCSVTDALVAPGTDGFPRAFCLPAYRFHNLFIVPPSAP